MHRCAKHLLVLVGGLVFTVVPALAAGSTIHIDSTAFKTTQTLKIGGAELKPGDYVIRGKESQPQLDVLENDKVIATVPCQWVRLDKKADQSRVLSSNSQVTEVQFQGRTEAAKIG
jgi:hypothetical protein